MKLNGRSKRKFRILCWNFQQKDITLLHDLILRDVECGYNKVSRDGSKNLFLLANNVTYQKYTEPG
jgi:hypothetical protein